MIWNCVFYPFQAKYFIVKYRMINANFNGFPYPLITKKHQL